jgi:hypothetical protein
MVRRTSLALPVLIAGALGALFCACSGSDQTGLFSPSGGVTGNAGASANAGGPNATGGRAATSGSSSAAGSTNAAGGSASGGHSSAGGAVGASGALNGGGSMNGGTGNGGAVSGGALNGGGSANGGNAGASTAGASNGGASGTGGAAGTGGASGGSGGPSGNPTCQDLIATAARQLDAARVCNTAGNAEQCTGTVSATCGCQVPVESDDSPETKAYLATLALIQEQHCIQVCPAIACVFGHAECKSQGGSSSVCVAAPLTPVN